ncbi:MAG: dehypoxanthine futalosine cyclase [Acidobacteria bacterium 21-70-11]|nr:MAG: dehypoxanthine futalosine cyclase [Acidobacteria bacterium 21-70-11]OYW07043.1 MAG: dehypoxanthine futalosine cyclase [Acidobacteria bacterium 37-71-11]
MRELLDDAVGGRRLTREELRRLFDEASLHQLGAAAHAVRCRENPVAEATYIIDRNINYTNVCVYRCKFCAFYRAPGDADAYVLPFEAIARKVEETIAAGGTGILLQGGVHPALRIDFYEGLLRQLKAAFPAVHLHAFSAPEVWYIAKVERLPLPEVIARLRAAGLESIPGGGAEVLEDETRKRIWSRAKASTSQWLEVHREAHRQGMRTTATMMFGVGEPYAARVEHFLRVRELQDSTGGFTAFIPWTFQEENTALAGEAPVSGGFDYLRTLAISRLALDNVRHVQGSWVTQGSKIGQLSLFFGADDLGSIMLEENVVAAAGTRNHMTREEMERIIADAGFTPRQRRTLYEPM